MSKEEFLTSNGPTVESVEEYIHFLKDTIGSGASNISPTEYLDEVSYNSKLNDIGYEYFIMYGDNHYFVARTLFMNFVFEYSLFSAYQCIENYLKAFIKSKNQVPPQTHSLTRLRTICIAQATIEDSFIRSEEISTIIYKYEPFYTIPRYPVTKTKWVAPASLHPDDIYVLDYFVLKFRKMLPLPGNMADILKGNDIHAFLCKRHSPGFYNTFLQGNINFGSGIK